MNVAWEKFWLASIETIYMTSISFIIAAFGALILGVILYLIKKGGLYARPFLYSILSTIINFLRLTPFIILMLLLVPITRFIIGTSIGINAVIIALVVFAVPYITRLIENALSEVDAGVIELAQSLGASKWELIFKFLLPGAAGSIISALTVAAVSLIGATAVAGTIGGGGLGDLAIQWGYSRYDYKTMFLAVFILIVFVQLVQIVGVFLAKKFRYFKTVTPKRKKQVRIAQLVSVGLLCIFIGASFWQAIVPQTRVIKIGLNGTQSKQWEYVKTEAAKENIILELVFFSDYVQPNRALVDGEIDANAFQTVSFLRAFNNDQTGEDIVPIGTTILAPMGIYSEKIKDLKDLKVGSKVTIPNDISNQGRALHLLNRANVITLRDGVDDYATIDDIVGNPKNIQITAMAANQLPPTIKDVDISVINNGVASDAGFKLTSAIFREDELAKSYINVIAVREQDKDDKDLKRIVELFQRDEVKEIIKKDTNENSIPVFVPLSDIGY